MNFAGRMMIMASLIWSIWYKNWIFQGWRRKRHGEDHKRRKNCRFVKNGLQAEYYKKELSLNFEFWIFGRKGSKRNFGFLIWRVTLKNIQLFGLRGCLVRGFIWDKNLRLNFISYFIESIALLNSFHHYETNNRKTTP